MKLLLKKMCRHFLTGRNLAGNAYRLVSRFHWDAKRLETHRTKLVDVKDFMENFMTNLCGTSVAIDLITRHYAVVR